MLYCSLLSSLKMPMLGLGTWQATAEIMEATLNAALNIGYRHIDTAILYENEHTIGKVINKWIGEGKLKREDLFIATKLPPMGMYQEKVEDSLKDSLKNLQLDYVDLYLIHSPEGIKNIPANKQVEMDNKVDHYAVWKKLEEQVRAGRTKAIGLSNFNERQVQNIFSRAEIKPANLQIEIHLYHQEKDVVNYCKANDITVTAYSPLGSPGMSAFYESYGVKKDLPKLLENAVVQQLAEKYGKTVAQILLRHTVQRGISVIPKSSNPARLKENFEIFDFVISDEDMEKLNAQDIGTLGKVGNWESWTWV